MNFTNTSRSRGFTRMELLVVICIYAAILLVVGGLGVKLFGGKGMVEYSSGQRTGINYKISKKGWIWYTYEGELSLQLTLRNSDGGLINQVFHYSVSDPAIAKKIERLSVSGKPITLHYKEYLFRGYKYGDTSYDIVDVTVPEQTH